MTATLVASVDYACIAAVAIVKPANVIKRVVVVIESLLATAVVTFRVTNADRGRLLIDAFKAQYGDVLNQSMFCAERHHFRVVRTDKTSSLIVERGKTKRLLASKTTVETCGENEGEAFDDIDPAITILEP